MKSAQDAPSLTTRESAPSSELADTSTRRPAAFGRRRSRRGASITALNIRSTGHSAWAKLRCGKSVASTTKSRQISLREDAVTASRGHVLAAGLSFEPNGVPHPRHADIIGWRDEGKRLIAKWQSRSRIG